MRNIQRGNVKTNIYKPKVNGQKDLKEVLRVDLVAEGGLKHCSALDVTQQHGKIRNYRVGRQEREADNKYFLLPVISLRGLGVPLFDL